MTDYVIEKNIPMAATTRNGRASKTGLLARMDIGDSFVVPTLKDVQSFRSCARSAGMRTCSRKVENGFRVWRTK